MNKWRPLRLLVQLVMWLCLFLGFAACDRTQEERGTETPAAREQVSKRGAKTPASGEEAAERGAQGAASRATLAGVTITVNGTAYAMRKNGSGYLLEGGGQTLKIKVESDRVKVKDAAGKVLAKVKAKVAGFKLYGATGDNAILKGKRRGDGYKLVRKPSGEELGRVEKGAGTIGKDPVSVADGKISRAGTVVAEIKGDVPATAAALWAATELPFAERLAMFVFAAGVAR